MYKLAIYFNQTNSGSNVRISGAWEGISLQGTGAGTPGGPFIDDVELGVVDICLYINGLPR